MGTMTKRQRAVIEDIELKLGIKYEDYVGPTLADRFIKKHIVKLREYNKKMNIPIYPSKKQADIIKAIEKDGSVKFNGKSRQEASEFIEKYMHLAEFKRTPRIYF